MYEIPRAHPRPTSLWRWWATIYLLAALISALAARLVVNQLCAAGCGQIVYHFEGYTLPAQLKSARGVGFWVAGLTLALTVTLGTRLMSRLVVWQPPWRLLLGGWVALSVSGSLMAGSIGFVVAGNNADAHPRVIGPLIFSFELLFFCLPVIYWAGWFFGRLLEVELSQLGRWSRRYAGAAACAWIIFVVAAALCGPEDITLAYAGWAAAWTLCGLVSGALLMPLIEFSGPNS